jgi:O-antigen/teichoic acid export membrane protein
MIKNLKSFLFENKTNGQTIAKNTVWLAGGKLGGRLLRTVLVIYAARVLGAADWGIFSYAISLIAIFAIVTDFGVSPLLIRETARDNESSKKEKILSTAFFLKMLLLLPAVIFIIFFANYLPLLKTITPILGLFALILIFDSFRQLGFSVIKAMEKMELQAGLYLLTNATIVITGLFFLSRSPSITSLTYAYVCGAGIGVFATLFVLRKQLRKIKFDFNWLIAKEILSSAWPFAISSLLGSIMISTDIFLIGFFRSASEVGFYSVADRVIQVLYAPALILATSTFPVFSRLANRNNQKIKEIFDHLLKLISLSLIPLVIIGMIVAPFVVTLIFGKEYFGAILPLQILFPTLLIRYISILLSNTVFAYDKQKELLKYALMGIITNIILDLLLIPTFGIAGSAVATLLAQIISVIYLWRKVKTLNSFSFPTIFSKTKSL